MTVAQCKASRRRMILRYGDGRRFGWSLAESVEKERQKAERARAMAANKKVKGKK